ncbi:MAG: glycosyltransferase family 2 protein [Paludibacter sp.]|jgi:glycosyltransferase involved in cell wall biosynthesis|nr:glycosyltransferase family 2 protein [Paludibacter sp.]
MLKISYIIPCYNGERYIADCLDNILSQNLPESDYEIVCVNDCSTDLTADIITQFRQKHQNIVLVQHSENKRQGGAKNTGIRSARGEYLVFIDQDDQLGNLNTAEIYQNVKNAELDVAAFKFLVELQAKRWYEKGTLDSESPIMTGKEYCEQHATPEISFAPWSYWYRREYLLKLNRWFAEKVMWEDADWVAQAVFFAEKIKFFPIVVYRWAYNHISISHTIDYRTLADMILMGWRKFYFANEIEQTSPVFSQIMKSDGLYNGACIKNIWKLDSNAVKLFYLRIKTVNSTEQYIGSMRAIIKFLYRNNRFVCSAIKITTPIINFLRFFKRNVNGNS